MMSLLALDCVKTLMLKAEEGWLHPALGWSWCLGMIAQLLLLEKLLDSAKDINDKIVVCAVTSSSCT